MAFIDDWRSQVPAALAQLAGTLTPNVPLDLGLLATGALWPIRQAVQDYDGEAIDAVQQATGADAGRVLWLVRAWPTDQPAAAERTRSAATDDAAVRAALERLTTFFGADALLAKQILQHVETQPNATNLYGDIRAALLNIGGTINIAALTIQVPAIIIHPPAPPVPAVSPAPRNDAEVITLKNIRRIWINDLLERSLYHEARIALNLTEQPDALALPLYADVQEFRHSPRTFSANTTITDIFDQMGGKLLILGEAGVGKSTLLLVLLEALLAQAERDAQHPIPLVFKLASWAQSRRRLDEWLVERLQKIYEVPANIGTNWIMSGADGNASKVLLLLDGLDEVEQEHREACVAAINIYRQEHGLTQMLVSCRLKDYQALKTQVQLNGAVTVHQLTLQQIDRYLEGAGAKLAHVRAAIKRDPLLYELANTPLMLHMMSLAYRQEAATNATMPDSQLELPTTGDPEERRRQLFDTYIRVVFARGAAHQPYSLQQTYHWLSWLSRTLSQRNEAALLLEYMQPDWLSARLRHWCHILVVVIIALSAGLLGLLAGFEGAMRLALVAGLAALLGSEFRQLGETGWSSRQRLVLGLLVGIQVGVYIGFSSLDSPPLVTALLGAIYGLFAGVFAGLFAGRTDHIAIRLAHVLRIEAGLALKIGLSVGIGVGLGPFIIRSLAIIIKPTSEEILSVLAALLPTLRIVVVFGLGTGLLTALFHKITPVETFDWKQFRWKSTLGVGLLVGLSYILIVVMHHVLGIGYLSPGDNTETVLLEGLRVSFFFGLLAGLTTGTIKLRTTPNQGIWRSARYTLWGCAIGVGIALVTNYTSGFGLITGLTFWLILALRLGYAACVQHLVLRCLLVLSRATPRRYVRFLNYAADRILLRKAGGSYSFVHPLLMTYFAQADGLSRKVESDAFEHIPATVELP